MREHGLSVHGEKKRNEISRAACVRVRVRVPMLPHVLALTHTLSTQLTSFLFFHPWTNSPCSLMYMPSAQASANPEGHHSHHLGGILTQPCPFPLVGTEHAAPISPCVSASPLSLPVPCRVVCHRHRSPRFPDDCIITKHMSSLSAYPLSRHASPSTRLSLTA